MPVPENFNSTDHLRNAIYKVYRREVLEWFQDIDFEALDLNLSRHNLAQACRPAASDSLVESVARMMLSETVRGRFASLLSGGLSDGIGETRYRTNVQRKSRPQIILFFSEDIGDVEPGYSPVSGRISFRLMNHTRASLTEAVARSYATTIKSRFAGGGGFVWKKGREMCSYSDWDSGYQLQVLCRSEAEGRRVVETVLDIQNDTPTWSYFCLLYTSPSPRDS